MHLRWDTSRTLAQLVLFVAGEEAEAASFFYCLQLAVEAKHARNVGRPSKEVSSACSICWIRRTENSGGGHILISQSVHIADKGAAPSTLTDSFLLSFCHHLHRQSHHAPLSSLLTPYEAARFRALTMRTRSYAPTTGGASKVGGEHRLMVRE